MRPQKSKAPSAEMNSAAIHNMKSENYSRIIAFLTGIGSVAIIGLGSMAVNLLGSMDVKLDDLSSSQDILSTEFTNLKGDVVDIGNLQGELRAVVDKNKGRLIAIETITGRSHSER